MLMNENRLFKKTPKLKSICHTMHAIEYWALDDIAVINEKLISIIPLLNDCRKRGDFIYFLKSNEVFENILQIYSYVKTSYFYVFMAFLDDTFPVLSFHYVIEMNARNEQYSLLIDRLRVLKKLNLLQTIFSPARTRLISGLLENDDDEVYSIEKDKTALIRIVSAYPSEMTLPDESPEWLVEKIDSLIVKIEQFVKNNENYDEEESEEDEDHDNSFRSSAQTLPEETDEFDDYDYDEEEEEENIAIDIAITNLDKIKAENNKLLIEWVSQEDIKKASVGTVELFSDSAKIKKLIGSIKNKKPGLKVNDFSIFDTLNEQCANFKEVTEFYQGSFILNQSKPDNAHYHVPVPVLIIGDHGIGKTHYAKMLARLLNTTSYFIDANSISASWVLTGGSSSWQNSKPGLIFKHLNECETVSPVIIFDEIDKLNGQKNYDTFSTFHQLLEKENASTLVDEYLDLKFDASHIFYILSANKVDNIPETLLSRMKVFYVGKPSFKESMKIAQNIYHDLTGGSSIFTKDLSEESCAILAEYTPREIKQIIMDSLYTQATKVSGTINNVLRLKLTSPQAHEKESEQEDTIKESKEDTNKGYLH